MRAEELRIGDWVSVSGTPMRIAALGTVKAGFLDGKGEMFFRGYDSIEPILLTDEIIKEAGFIRNYDDYNQFFIKLKRHILWLYGSRTEHNTYYVRALEDVKVRYTHEFQHLLRLCGIEKEIEAWQE